MQRNKLTNSDKLIAVSAIALFGCAFLPWFGFAKEFSRNGWHYALFGIVPTILGLGVLAVVIVQVLAVLLLHIPRRNVLRSPVPAVFTIACVSAAVVVFREVTARDSRHPLRTYRRIALVVLLLSFIPDIAIGMSWIVPDEGWPLAIVYMVMHVVAWAVTVTMLTSLTGITDVDGATEG